MPTALVRALLAGAATALLLAAPAQAAPYGCDASALRGQVLAAPAVEPVTANRGAGPCATVRAGGTLGLPPLAAAAAVAQTTLSNPDAPQRTQAVVAAGGVADLVVGGLPSLGVALPLGPVNAAIDAIGPIGLTSAGGSTTVTSPLGVPVTVPIALPVSASVDVRPALRALVGQLGQLPRVDVLRLQSAVATVAGRCADGRAEVTGGAQSAGLTVLGQPFDTTKAVEAPVRLLDTTSVDPTRVLDDPDLFKLVAGPVGVDATTLKALLRPVLAALPAISIPQAVASVRVTPAEQVREGARLTQRALRVEVTAVGQRVLDLVLGEASVTAGGIDCSEDQGAVLTASEQALACTTRRLVLVDVLPAQGRVQLFGAADKRLAGRTVQIVFDATREVVARARVRADGSFQTTAPLPPRAIRRSNLARYQARIGRERSLALKLERRMVVRSIRSSGGRVTIVGRISRPLASPLRTIEVRQRLSCQRTKVVARVRPARDGTFRVRLAAPARQASAVYRLATRVRRTTRNPKTFPTFTLPRAVDLLG